MSDLLPVESHGDGGHTADPSRESETDRGSGALKEALSRVPASLSASGVVAGVSLFTHLPPQEVFGATSIAAGLAYIGITAVSKALQNRETSRRTPDEVEFVQRAAIISLLRELQDSWMVYSHGNPQADELNSWQALLDKYQAWLDKYLATDFVSEDNALKTALQAIRAIVDLFRQSSTKTARDLDANIFGELISLAIKASAPPRLPIRIIGPGQSKWNLFMAIKKWRKQRIEDKDIIESVRHEVRKIELS